MTALIAIERFWPAYRFSKVHPCVPPFQAAILFLPIFSQILLNIPKYAAIPYLSVFYSTGVYRHFHPHLCIFTHSLIGQSPLLHNCTYKNSLTGLQLLACSFPKELFRTTVIQTDLVVLSIFADFAAFGRKRDTEVLECPSTHSKIPADMIMRICPGPEGVG